MECKQCRNQFEIFPEDRKFYELMEVPPPTHCPPCRMQRRLIYRNERYLYRRTCALTGKEIIASFSEDKPFPVYENDAWWSDQWSALDYGRDFDFTRPFFEQFFELRDQVPRLALQQQKPMWNSPYCNCASQNKNCHLVFSTNRCEDCYYGSWVNDCKDCIDNKHLIHSELCYDCTSCFHCYNLKYSQDCTNCKDSYFLRDCQGCSNCFACSNLVNKQYYIFNQRKTKEEYEQFMQSINMGSYKIVQDGKSKAQKMLNDVIVKEYHGTNSEKSVGDYLFNCKNSYHCFDGENLEDCRYCFCLTNAKDCMDHSHWGGNSERTYECQACGYDMFNIRFSNLCWSGCSDLTYCDHCFSSKNCFGCVGLKKEEYCIFNKKYSPQDYEKLKSKIIEHMKQTGEWGEFFPAKHSCYAYNESLANEQIPLSEEEIRANNWPYKSKDSQEYLPPTHTPNDDITQTPVSIINEILACESCKKNYKILPEELKYYQRQQIPVPQKCPDCRHLDRLQLKNRYFLHKNACANCQKEITTAFEKDRPESVYCEACYLKKVF